MNGPGKLSEKHAATSMQAAAQRMPMNLGFGFGYDKAIYVLPFSHRHSYVTGMFEFKLPQCAQQHNQVSDSKQLSYQGSRQALTDGAPSQMFERQCRWQKANSGRPRAPMDEAPTA